MTEAVRGRRDGGITVASSVVVGLDVEELGGSELLDKDGLVGVRCMGSRRDHVQDSSKFVAGVVGVEGNNVSDEDDKTDSKSDLGGGSTYASFIVGTHHFLHSASSEAVID